MPFLFFYKKGLTTGWICAILCTEREKEGTKMENWYMNPENHAEDYEELLELLAESAEG